MCVALFSKGDSAKLEEKGLEVSYDGLLHLMEIKVGIEETLYEDFASRKKLP